MLRGKELAGATESGLDFIRHQQDIVLLADLGYLLEISGGRNNDTALTLNGFQKNSRRICRDRFLDGIHISIRNIHKSGRKRTEVVAVGGFGGEADNGDCPP